MPERAVERGVHRATVQTIPPFVTLPRNGEGKRAALRWWM
jgi:hypothetical protein